MRTFILIILATSSFLGAVADNISDLKARRQAEMKDFLRERTTEINSFRDSVNKEYASFLEERWAEFNLMRNDRGFKPMPKPPVYIPKVADIKNEDKVNNNATNQIPSPQLTLPSMPEDKKLGVTRDKNAIAFFGREIEVDKPSLKISHMADASESSVSGFWKELSKLDIERIIDAMTKAKFELNLNDWGVFLLAKSISHDYFDNLSANEQTVFTVFLLNQLDYKAKIGRNGRDLYTLLSIDNTIHNTSYFKDPSTGDFYYAISETQKPLGSIEMCRNSFPQAKNRLTIDLSKVPSLGYEETEVERRLENDTLLLKVNRLLTGYQRTIPCLSFADYATAELDTQTFEPLIEVLKAKIYGKSFRESINYLLRFVQFGFDYKTDDENYGFEKWNFPEETIQETYCDCEDRSILLCQLAKQVLNADMALVYYPGLHISAAVAIDDPQPNEKVVDNHNGKNFVICDPTYIGASLGMEMPMLNSSSKEIIHLTK